jgi:hypothetical protein
MASFTFVGDPRHRGDGPEQITLLGVAFRKGEPTEVKDNVARKLRKHTHFRGHEGADADKPAPPREKPAKARRGRRKKARPAKPAVEARAEHEETT